MWDKLTERNGRTRTKIGTELYRFLATPGLEVTNLAFASDDVVWLSWKVSAEDNVANQPHTKEVIREDYDDDDDEDRFLEEETKRFSRENVGRVAGPYLMH